MNSVEQSVNNLEDNFRNIKYSRAGNIVENIYRGDGLWSKVVFFIFVLIFFILTLRGAMRMLTWFFSPSEDPILVNGLKDASKPLLVNVDPSNKGSMPIIRSINEGGGLEFTWSVWVNIKRLEMVSESNSTPGDYYHIFNKGNLPENYNQSGDRNLANIQDAPGLYLDKITNKIKINMKVYDKNTGTSITENIYVDKIPLNKWVNIGIRVQGKNLDVFINGEIKTRHKLKGVAKQNYGPVYVNMNGGFNGELSELRYFNRAITGIDFINIAKKGPNMREYSKYGLPSPPYFSQRWFLSRFEFNKDANAYSSSRG
tara:strand:+ start:2615 stop:3556 length:942 start_codon:yes stop_codon:yes gene_type:complete